MTKISKQPISSQKMRHLITQKRGQHVNYLEQNIKLIHDMELNNMENSFKHITGLKKTLLTINKSAIKIPESRQTYHTNTGNYLIRYDTINSTNKVSDREKYLLQLLILSNCIRRVSFYDLPLKIQRKYARANDYRAYIYEILPLRIARFDRLRKIKKCTPLNYSDLCLIEGVELANQVFKRFTTYKGYYYFSPDSLELIANYVWTKHTATLNDIANFYLDNMLIRPKIYGKNMPLNRDEEVTYIISVLKALNDSGWWKKYDINIKRNGQLRRNKLQDVNGNTLVITEEKRKIKKHLTEGNPLCA